MTEPIRVSQFPPWIRTLLAGCTNAPPIHHKQTAVAEAALDRILLLIRHAELSECDPAKLSLAALEYTRGKNRFWPSPGEFLSIYNVVEYDPLRIVSERERLIKERRSYYESQIASQLAEREEEARNWPACPDCGEPRPYDDRCLHCEETDRLRQESADFERMNNLPKTLTPQELAERAALLYTNIPDEQFTETGHNRPNLSTPF